MVFWVLFPLFPKRGRGDFKNHLLRGEEVLKIWIWLTEDQKSLRILESMTLVCIRGVFSGLRSQQQHKRPLFKSSFHLSPEGLKCLPGKRPSSDFFLSVFGGKDVVSTHFKMCSKQLPEAACSGGVPSGKPCFRENYPVGRTTSCSGKSPWLIRTGPHRNELAMSDVTHRAAAEEIFMGWRNIMRGKNH